MCVTIHRRADVTPLGIHDAQSADLATCGDNLFEDGNTMRAMPFEESGLRLESGHASTECLDDTEGEFSHTIRVVVKSPFFEELA